DPVVHIGSTTGLAGQTVSFDVTLESGGQSVAGVQVDIAFDPNARIAATASNRPSCSVNPAINKNGTSFAFQPPGCTVGVSCTAVRSLVLALDNVDPIRDAPRLFPSNAATAPGAPNGVYPLPGSNAGAADPNGGALFTPVPDGSVPVGNPATATAAVTATPTAGDAAG